MTASCVLCARVVVRVPKRWELFGWRVCRRCYLRQIAARHYAYAIDFVIVYGLGRLLSWSIGAFGQIGSPINMMDYFQLCLLVLAIRVPLIVRDVVYGQSPGKWLMSLQVVDDKSGEPVGVRKAVSRNIVLILPIVSEVLIALSFARGYRFGDQWVGARVVPKGQRFRRPFAVTKGICEKCGYSLVGLQSDRCPECGTEFDMDEASSRL